MDSKLVVEQMSGRWKIKHEDMRRLALEARDLVAAISSVRRLASASSGSRASKNKAADALANAAHGRRDDRAPDLEETRRRPSAGDGGRRGDRRRPACRHGRPRRPARHRHARPASSWCATGSPTSPRGTPRRRGGADPSLNALGRRRPPRPRRATAHLLGDGAGARGDLVAWRAPSRPGLLSPRDRASIAEVDADWDEQALRRLGRREGRRPLRARPRRAAPCATTLPTPGPAARATTRWPRACWRPSIVRRGWRHDRRRRDHRKPIMAVLAHVLRIPHETIWRLAAAPGIAHGRRGLGGRQRVGGLHQPHLTGADRPAGEFHQVAGPISPCRPGLPLRHGRATRIPPADRPGRHGPSASGSARPWPTATTLHGAPAVTFDGQRVIVAQAVVLAGSTRGGPA